jgi:anti-sigma B factor antagonist
VPDFQVRVVSGDSATEIFLAGEVGMEIAGELTATGTEAVRTAAHPRVVIDLEGVTFLDSTGIGALVAIRTAALDNGKELRVRNVPPRVARLLSITGLTEAFPLDSA